MSADEPLAIGQPATDEAAGVADAEQDTSTATRTDIFEDFLAFVRAREVVSIGQIEAEFGADAGDLVQVALDDDALEEGTDGRYMLPDAEAAKNLAAEEEEDAADELGGLPEGEGEVPTVAEAAPEAAPPVLPASAPPSGAAPRYTVTIALSAVFEPDDPASPDSSALADAELMAGIARRALEQAYPGMPLGARVARLEAHAATRRLL